MKRSTFVLSFAAASIVGCFAFSGTASAVPPGPNACVTQYENCMLAGRGQDFCWAQLLECDANGGPTNRNLSLKATQIPSNLPPSPK